MTKPTSGSGSGTTATPSGPTLRPPRARMRVPPFVCFWPRRPKRRLPRIRARARSRCVSLPKRPRRRSRRSRPLLPPQSRSPTPRTTRAARPTPSKTMRVKGRKMERFRFPTFLIPAFASRPSSTMIPTLTRKLPPLEATPPYPRPVALPKSRSNCIASIAPLPNRHWHPRRATRIRLRTSSPSWLMRAPSLMKAIPLSLVTTQVVLLQMVLILLPRSKRIKRKQTLQASPPA
mmetsp:Transcript_36529/g.79536  ORF Transcript_36529/g.79536 Transcript_36529/m.79536 type:complete len:233 (+) Transcript_36529:1011-1709(+)